MDQPDLRSSEHYINRELSLLEFNERVLAQALDETKVSLRGLDGRGAAVIELEAGRP